LFSQKKSVTPENEAEGRKWLEVEKLKKKEGEKVEQAWRKKPQVIALAKELDNGHIGGPKEKKVFFWSTTQMGKKRNFRKAVRTMLALGQRDGGGGGGGAFDAMTMKEDPFMLSRKDFLVHEKVSRGGENGETVNGY